MSAAPVALHSGADLNLQGQGAREDVVTKGGSVPHPAPGPPSSTSCDPGGQFQAASRAFSPVPTS